MTQKRRKFESDKEPETAGCPICGRKIEFAIGARLISNQREFAYHYDSRGRSSGMRCEGSGRTIPECLQYLGR